MPIQQGDKLPHVTLKTLTAEGPSDIDTAALFAGKKVVLFAVPGAFTPTCSAAHVPGFVVHADAIKAKGVDIIACISVNDAFVMGAWGESQNAENILMLADGNAAFTQEIGLTKDATAHGMGIRSLRYAMIVNDGLVEYLAVDQSGLELSSAEAILKKL